MPWYSMYSPESPQRNRYRPQSRNPTSNNGSYHNSYFTPSSYSSSTSFTRHHYTPSYPSQQSAHRHFEFDRFRTKDGNNRHASPSGSSHFRSRCDGSDSWHHRRRTVDSATERLLARADALTERLHRLLAKSADLHWRRMDQPTTRPDIFSHMSQSRTTSTATRADETDTASVKVDDITVSKSEPRPTTRTHVITIKLTNSFSNRAPNHRSSSPESPKPQEPPPPPKSHDIKQEEHHPSSSRYYRRQSTPRKPPVIRIIPIQIEVESDDSGVVIDPERDIQVPDEDPISPSPRCSNVSSVHSVPVVVEALPKLPVIDCVESDSEIDPDLELEIPVCARGDSTSSRRWALTLR